MFLSNVSVRRPVAMSCLIIGLTLLGLNAYRKMGLELMPKMDMPFITIVTVYPGASPEQIETDVAKRIEDEMVTIDGLKHVSSSCMENVCQTFLEFNMDVNVDIAATDVREKIDLILEEFPEDVEDPKILKYDINAKPVVNMVLTGDVALDALYDYADNTLSDRITVISGVASVELIGGAQREVHVLLDRKALAARGLSSVDVVGAIQRGIRTIPSGHLEEGGTEYSVKFDAEYSEIASIGTLEVVNREGQRCYIDDVGRVEMTTEEVRQTASLDGEPCVAIKVVKKSEANAVKVVNRVREAMEALRGELPGGMELVWVYDDGVFIEASVASAWKNVAQGVGLTALILFLFLYNVRSTVIVATTMPLTIVIGLFFMQMMGYTLNTSTLISIGLSVGILVTNSIVVLEAIVKRLGQTGDAKEAARLGAAEATLAILASVGTNVVVLFPIAMMGGKLGLFLKPLALTMVIMTVVSLFISFTLTPMLCSLFLKPQDPHSRSPLRYMERGWNWMFARVTGGYGRVLRFNERHRWAALLVLAGVVFLLFHSFSLAGGVGFDMVPASDQGRISLKLEYPARYSLAETSRRVEQVRKELATLAELQHTLSMIGKVEGMVGQSSEGVYLAEVMLVFSDRDKREITIDALRDEIRRRLAAVPECIVTANVPSVINGSQSDIELEIYGDELETLDRLALETKAYADMLEGVCDQDTTVRMGKPEIRVYPRRAVLSDMGVPVSQLGMVLRANLEGLEAGTFKRNARNYDIVVELEDTAGKKQVEEFLLPGGPGRPLLLTSVGRVEERLAPVQITRKDKRRVSKFYGNTAGIALGTAVDRIVEGIEREGEFPPGYGYTFSGTYELMAEMQADMGEAGLTAIVLVILTLAAIMESFKQPWLILVTVPLSLIGVFYALSVGGQSMGMFVLMGIVMMIGIVVNNAILIMDQFNVHVAEGVPRHKAMITAATERFRPIIMITAAAVLGFLPLALGQGIGAEMRNGVGVASVGGILVSGVLTLVVVPILYDLTTRKGKASQT